jgi:hypothetical protein
MSNPRNWVAHFFILLICFIFLLHLQPQIKTYISVCAKNEDEAKCVETQLAEAIGKYVK